MSMIVTMQTQLRETTHALCATARCLDAVCDNLTQMGFFDRPHGKGARRHLADIKATLEGLGLKTPPFDADDERDR